MENKFNYHLFEIDTLTQQRVDKIVDHMAKNEGTDEAVEGKRPNGVG